MYVYADFEFSASEAYLITFDGAFEVPLVFMKGSICSELSPYADLPESEAVEAKTLVVGTIVVPSDAVQDLMLLENTLVFLEAVDSESGELMHTRIWDFTPCAYMDAQGFAIGSFVAGGVNTIMDKGPAPVGEVCEAGDCACQENECDLESTSTEETP